MDASEPRVRRRGFFAHSDTTGEPETTEHENPEGFVVRFRGSRQVARRRNGGHAVSGGRSHSTTRPDDGGPQFRSGSATGSRQRVDLPR